MKKRWLSRLLIVSMLCVCAPIACAAELAPNAPSAILMEAATGQILYEKNAHEALAPASVTKVMTLLLVMEALEDGRIGWDDTVIVSEAAANKGGSQVFLEPNEQMPLRDMLKAVVVSSANDCACALAEHIAGSESAFVQRMNERAQELGMTNTHFVNCTGLDDDADAAEHLTSAHDIAVMSRELLKHDAIREYTTIWMDTIRDGKFGLSNTNKLVRFYDGTTGLKTGYTSAAGYCLAASAARGGMELIAVVMHCDTSTNRFEAAKSMLNHGFSNYALVTPAPAEPIGEVAVKLGTAQSITPVLQEQTPLLLDKSQAASVRCEVQLEPEVQAPVEQGAPLGKLIVYAKDAPICEIPLICPETIEALSWWDITLQMLKTICMG